ncbi:hypothetical protein ACFZC7_35380 [Streptomyces massasporeus]|uniref:hypothetical protein n=1 Tax=Streptomyces massasporeus TaxID=67324 RepID=UPI0036E10B0B
MELTDAVVVVLLVVGFFAPALSKLVTSVAFRIRAAGKAEMIRAKTGEAQARGERRKGKRGRRG